MNTMQAIASRRSRGGGGSQPRAKAKPVKNTSCHAKGSKNQGPTMPSTLLRRCSVWNSITRARVLAPKMPSTTNGVASNAVGLVVLNAAPVSPVRYVHAGASRATLPRSIAAAGE